MNKISHYLNVILLLLSITFFSCNDNAVLEILPEPALSRSTDKAIEPSGVEKYYYYHHERTYVELDTTKEYVIMRKRSAVSRSTENCLYNNDLYDYTGYIVNKSETPSILLSNDNYEVIAIEDVIIKDIPLSPYIYVSLKKSSDLTLLTKLAEQIGWRVCGSEDWNENVKILSSSSGKGIHSLEAARYLYENGDFNYVDPDISYKYQCLYLPSEPNYTKQWNLKSYPGINVSTIWNLTKGDNVTLGIVDTGIFSYSPEFSSHMHSFCYPPNSTLYSYHGTGVAAIAAASHNNDGIVGIAPNVNIMDINAYTTDTYSGKGYFSPQIYVEGIGQAISNGADVLNCSWGGSKKENNEAKIESLAKNGRSGKGTLIVFAAGNSGEEGIAYPGKGVPSAIRVGSVDQSGKVSSFSSRGSELDVVAPGENVLTWTSASTIESSNGTSFAAPHVAGLACLILSLRPDLTAAQVKQLIIETASRSTHSNDYGWGLVNAQAIVDALQHNFSFDMADIRDRIITNNRYTYKLVGVPRGATTKWSAAVGTLNPNTAIYNSATFTYPGIGKYTEHVSATVTYMGRTTTFKLDCTVESPPEITSVEIDDVNMFDSNEIYLYAECSQLHPNLQWMIVGGNNNFALQDFPLSGDANYLDTWERYICLTYGLPGDSSILDGAWCRLKVTLVDYGIDYYCTVRRTNNTWVVES